jgi:hypothetical protein
MIDDTELYTDEQIYKMPIGEIINLLNRGELDRERVNRVLKIDEIFKMLDEKIKELTLEETLHEHEERTKQEAGK